MLNDPEDYEWSDFKSHLKDASLGLQPGEIHVKFKPGTSRKLVTFFSKALHLKIWSSENEEKFANPLVMIASEITEENLTLNVSKTANLVKTDRLQFYAVQRRIREISLFLS